MNIAELKNSIRSVPDFPKKGIVFLDITTLLKNGEAFSSSVELFFQKYKEKNISKVIGIESRGFIFGAALAYKLKCGFVPIRKPKKLPAEKIQQEYQLEYGSDAVEIHKDAIERGEKILLVDDLLATGGTMCAATQLVEQLGGEIIGIAFLIELNFLNGREKLKKYDVHSLIHYEKE
ncbi:MAG: adenine phosphoribosyltransferase [Ignavibacteriales bacterium]|nr:adenine phosphoribosyltransferase [Ignavibacteriales bacterium]